MDPTPPHAEGIPPFPNASPPAPREAIEPATGPHGLKTQPGREVGDESLRLSPTEAPHVSDPQPCVRRTLISPLDGHGLGTIVISSTLGAERRTAAFLCDVSTGIRDALGQVEEESPVAGSLLDALRDDLRIDGREHAPKLSLALLAGCLLISPNPRPPNVTGWLEATVGPRFEPRPIAYQAPDANPPAEANLNHLAHSILDACPGWLDASSLTFELAEEILLREGPGPVDPGRDSGAFRYLFEHRLIHRLELYRNMLWWMMCYWSGIGAAELAGAAGLLAARLADEQFAVPSNPFALAVTARSFEAAMERLGTAADPRRNRAGLRPRPRLSGGGLP